MKTKIAVLFGGVSAEHEISIQSAAAVSGAIDRARYTVFPIYITTDGAWYLLPDEAIRPAELLQAGKAKPAILSPEPGKGLLIGQGAQMTAEPLDAILPILHGKNGEDGSIQGLASLAGIPVLGCGIFSSALGMDKYRAHLLAEAAGIAVPQGALFTPDCIDRAPAAAEKLGFPVFVKPVKSGSSFGITRVCTPAQLPEALALALRYDDSVLVEENIQGVELGCAVLETAGGLVTGAVDEIALQQGFFDFEEKYTLKTAAIHCPARIPQKVADTVAALSKTIFRLFDCKDFARIDFFYAGGKILFNEINTIPGFTAHSRFPQMLVKAGMSFEQVVAEILSRIPETDGGAR